MSSADAEAHAYAWNWFALHSGQRMQMVSYWLVAISFLGAAFMQARTANLTAVAVGVCVAGAVSSISFAMLDARTRRLIQVSEEALRKLEQLRVAAGAASEARLATAAHEARTFRVASYRIVIESLQLLMAGLFTAGAIYSMIVR